MANDDGTVSVINGRTNTVTATIPVGGVPFGVAVDPKTNTIYVTNHFSDTVSVISGRTNTVTATIPVGGDPNGVAVDRKTNTIYVANLRDSTVSMISGRTNTVTATIPVGREPFGVAVNAKTNTIYVANEVNRAHPCPTTFSSHSMIGGVKHQAKPPCQASSGTAHYVLLCPVTIFSTSSRAR